VHCVFCARPYKECWVMNSRVRMCKIHFGGALLSGDSLSRKLSGYDASALSSDFHLSGGFFSSS
jgi:hypothetical protein